mgnify:CR=1 FL=1
MTNAEKLAALKRVKAMDTPRTYVEAIQRLNMLAAIMPCRRINRARRSFVRSLRKHDEAEGCIWVAGPTPGGIWAKKAEDGEPQC